MFSAFTTTESVPKLCVPPGWFFSTLYVLGFPKRSNVMPSTELPSLWSSSSVTLSASTSWMSSLTSDLKLGFCARMAKASPSWHRAILIVRSFAASWTRFAHTAKSCSTSWFSPSLSKSIWRRGPVPTVSLAMVETIPRA